MTGGFGLGEGAGESAEGSIVDDLFGVTGHGLAQVTDVPFHVLLGRSVLGEGGQWFGCSVVVGGLEMDEGLLSGGYLLVVVVELVPTGGGGDDEDGGVEEHRQGRAVLGGGLAEYGPYGAAQGAGVVVFGADAGTGGALEGSRCLTELVSQVLWCDERKGVEGFAEGSQVALRGYVTSLVEVVGNAFDGGGGLVPGVGLASARSLDGLCVDAVEAFPDLRER